MRSAKDHITKIVETYIKLFPEDFETVKKGIQMQRGLFLDDFASAKLQGSPDTRALFEIPVDLHEMLVTNLSEEEMEWFKAGGRDRKEGALWFAKTFKDFTLPNKI